jgi:hypothetical protein
MTSLAAAHRGYEYQDLLVACRLVDMLLGTVLRAHVDQKLVDDDRFDDLSTVDITGTRERTQFKHTENADRPLSLATFTADGRGLRLDRVVASILGDRSGPGRLASRFSYRIVLRDGIPVDPSLTRGIPFVCDRRQSSHGGKLRRSAGRTIRCREVQARVFAVVGLPQG